MKSKEIERMLREDIREKKKTASGSFHMRGKGVKHGFSGALRTPSYYMSNKQKNQLNGELKVSNMYETILSKEEFFKHSEEMQKIMLTKWRENYQNNEIMEHMGISGSGAFAKIIERLEIPKKPRIYNENSHKKKRTARITKKTSAITQQTLSTNTQPNQGDIQQPQAIKLLQTGLSLEYNGTYDADQLSKIFTKLQLITDGEECKFLLNISLSERT